MSRGGYPRSHVQRGVSTHPWTYQPLPLCAIHPFLSRIPTPLGYPPEYPLLDIPILPDILTPWTYPPQLVTLVVITGDILTPTPTPPEHNDRHLWKHYLPATSSAGGKYRNTGYIYAIEANKTVKKWTYNSMATTIKTHGKDWGEITFTFCSIQT